MFFLPVWYNIYNLQDYFDSFKTSFNVIYTNDANYALTLCPDKVFFVFEISDQQVYECFSSKNIDICIFNSEPLNLNCRFLILQNYINKYNMTVYDYSLSNIKILNMNGYTNTKHLKYNITATENEFLKNLYTNTKKIYDFGIISPENPVTLKRRADVVNFLIEHNYSVKVIQGWKDQRDQDLAQCSVILNIHGSIYGENSNIFEHVRCDRLLSAGFKILSETSLYLDERFIKENSNNLKLMDYPEFFNTNIYKNLNWLNKTH